MASMRCASLILMATLFVSPVLGQDDWLGRKFMPKEGCAIKIGNREIPTKGVPLPHVVQQISGDWLWVGEGWVQKSRVVPLEQAIDYYTDYLRSHPNSAWAYNLRGWARYESGDYDNAVTDDSEAIRLAPQDAMAYNNRGAAWQKKGAYDNALKDYSEAIRFSPQETWGYNSVAWLLATCPEGRHRDGRRAVTMARKACELSNWKDAYSIDTLATAYAESGDFGEAIRWQNKAIEMLAAEKGDAEFLQAARDRLALYRDKKPYRESSGQ